MVLRENGRVVLRPALGLTAYLEAPEWWALQGAERAFGLLRDHGPIDRVRLFSTSMLQHWRAAPSHSLDSLQASLSCRTVLAGKPRHLFWAEFADYPNVPSIGMRYSEVETTRTIRHAFVQFTLPVDWPPEELLQLALRLANLGPVRSMVGGLCVRWNVLHQRLAFNQFYLWALRFVGLDCQDAEEMAWHTQMGLPGSNWLTFVGSSFADEQGLALDDLSSATWNQPVRTLPSQHGLLLQAGAAPTEGDLNQLRMPEAYMEVARRLEPYLVEQPPVFWGAFQEENRMHRWFRRLADSKGWPPQPALR